MQPAPTTKPPRDPQSLLEEQPGKLILDPGVDRKRIVVIGILSAFVMAGLVFAFVLFNRHGAGGWIVGLAVAMGLAVIIPLVLVFKRPKITFDLEERRMRRGKREVPFDDLLGVVLSTADAKPAKAKPAKAKAPALQSITLGLVVRTKESDLAERVVRIAHALSGGSDTAGQLATLVDRLRSEAERSARTLSPVAAFLAADRLAAALGVVLFDLRSDAVAWAPKELAKPLRKRLLKTNQAPPAPGPPPAQVTEEAGPVGPLLHFRRPRRQPLVSMIVNLGMLLVLLAIFFLFPSNQGARDFNWGQIWPLVMAILLVIPALVKSLFSQNWLELGAEHLRFVTRFLGEKSRDVEVARLRFLLIEEVGATALVLVADGPALRLSMPLESAKWVKARIETFLVSGS